MTGCGLAQILAGHWGCGEEGVVSGCERDDSCEVPSSRVPADKEALLWVYLELWRVLHDLNCDAWSALVVQVADIGITRLTHLTAVRLSLKPVGKGCSGASLRVCT